MQRRWAVAPVAAVAVLATQLAVPLPVVLGASAAVFHDGTHGDGAHPGTGDGGMDVGMDVGMNVALAAVERAVSWQCDLPHRTAAQRGAAQRTMASTGPAPAFVQRTEPVAGPSGPAPRPIPGFGGEPGQNPRVKINGGLAGPGGVDVYQIPMRAGEVFSATVRGSGGTLEVRDPQGVLVEGSGVDRSGIYPPASPLLGGGNATVDHVASVSGMHTLTVKPPAPGASGDTARGSSGTGASGAAPSGAAPSGAGPSGAGPGATPGATPGGADPADDPDGAAPDPGQVPVAGSAAAPTGDTVNSGTRVLPPVALEASAPEPNAAATPAGPDAPGGSRAGTGRSEPAGGPATVPPSEVAAPPGTPPAGDPRAYQLDLGVFRPAPNAPQKIVLEFDGATIDTRKFGLETAKNQVTLSALSTFLPRFGLTAADQPALMKRVADTVRENLSAAVGGGAVDVSTADRAGTSTFGKPGVSRVVIGGSSAEAGISTVGISESVDPGNFAHEETALVLLDRLSGPGNESVSLAHYLPGVVDRGRRIEFVGRALGNVASHEAGHFLGSWHTDAATPKHDLMAPGDVIGAFGFGPDKLGGTPDDVRSRFGQDRFAPAEGFTGTQDTRNRTLVGLRGMPDRG